MKKRIWEIDAFRGLCVLGMIAVHLVYDLTQLYGIFSWNATWFSFIQNWGAVLFLLISGISATLGSKSVRRGAIVFACGLLCTAVTASLYSMGLASKGIIIYFGVLHCLGICMMLWQAVKKLPTVQLAVLGAVLTLIGLWLRTQVFPMRVLMPLGFVYEGFQSSDYFPLIQNFGFFLLGAVLGRTLYRDKQTRFPNVRENALPLRFLRTCGKHSLAIYLLHQPAITAIGIALSLLRRH